MNQEGTLHDTLKGNEILAICAIVCYNIFVLDD